MNSIVTKTKSNAVSVLLLLSIPLSTAYIMSGMFLQYSVINVLWTVFAAALILYAVVWNKKLIFSAVMLTVFVFAVFCRCIPVYVYEYNYAEKAVLSLGGSTHSFAGYVCRENANAGEGMYIELISVDGAMLEKHITAYGINRAGHFLPEGGYVRFDAVLKKPESFSEDFDFVGWLYGKGVHCELDRMYEIFPESGLDRISVGAKLREWIYDNTLNMLDEIDGKSRFDHSTSLAKALMFGDKSGFSDEELEDFNRCGMSHLLCVSGLHFSLLIGMISAVTSVFVSKRKSRFILIAALSLIYLCMCGFSRSALRAAVMTLITLSGVYTSSRNSGTEKLLAAVGIICLVDPYSVYDVSFRLSVLSCGGIVCASHFSKLLHHKTNAIPVLGVFADIASMSVGAFAFTFPYTLTAFGGGSAVSVLSSLLAVIPAEICLVLLWLSVPAALAGIDFVLFAMASVYSRLCEFIFFVAEYFSELKYAYIQAELPDISFAVFFVLLIISAIGAYSGRRGRKIFFLVFIFSLISVIMLIVHNVTNGIL